MVRVDSPFPLFALPRLWTWVQRVRRHVCDDFSPTTIEQFVEQWQGDMARGGRTWAVYKGKDLVGLISAEQLSPVVATVHLLFHKSGWGHDTTVPALQEVFRDVFERAQKITALVFADNANVIGLARKVGAEKEGVLRAHTLREGRPADMVALGLLKEDFEKCLNSSR